MVKTGINIKKKSNNNHSNCESSCSNQNSDEEDEMPTTTASTTCCCLTCCYVTDTCDSSTVTRRIMCSKPKTFSTSSSSSSLSSSSSDSRDPPSEAAAFVASASAAAFILLVALLAVVLSSVAVLAVASAVPVADAAADVRPGTQTAADCPHRWHNQQRHRPNRLSVQQQQQQRVTSRHVDDDILRQKRQLFRKNVNREPGIIGLTFSLIGGTVSDVRQAFRNVSGIVRETVSEVAKAQLPVATPSVDGDPMMMAAGSSLDNEVGGGSNGTTAAPVDQRVAGQTLGKLLGRNYRGLRRLFNTELRSALKNSPGNVRDFASELVGSIGQSLRPSNLISRGPIKTNSTTTGR